MSIPELYDRSLSSFARPLTTFLTKSKHIASISVAVCVHHTNREPANEWSRLAAFLLRGQILFLRRSHNDREKPHQWTLPTADFLDTDETIFSAVSRALSSCANLRLKEVEKLLGWNETETGIEGLWHRRYYFLASTHETTGRDYHLVCKKEHHALPDGYLYAAFFNIHRVSDNYGNYGSDVAIGWMAEAAIDFLGGRKKRDILTMRNSRPVVFVNGVWKAKW